MASAICDKAKHLLELKISLVVNMKAAQRSGDQGKLRVYQDLLTKYNHKLQFDLGVSGLDCNALEPRITVLDTENGDRMKFKEAFVHKCSFYLKKIESQKNEREKLENMLVATVPTYYNRVAFSMDPLRSDELSRFKAVDSRKVMSLEETEFLLISLERTSINNTAVLIVIGHLKQHILEIAKAAALDGGQRQEEAVNHSDPVLFNLGKALKTDGKFPWAQEEYWYFELIKQVKWKIDTMQKNGWPVAVHILKHHLEFLKYTMMWRAKASKKQNAVKQQAAIVPVSKVQ